MDVLTSLVNGGSRADMERALPGMGSSSSSSNNSASRLRKALVDVSNLLKARDEALSRMEVALRGDGGDEFIEILLGMDKGTDKDESFKKEWQRRVGKDTQFLADSVKRQTDLMSQVTAEFEQWKKSEGDVDDKRAKAINSLRNCVDIIFGQGFIRELFFENGWVFDLNLNFYTKCPVMIKNNYL